MPPRRSFASPEKQAEARAEIRAAHPVQEAVKLLQADWHEVVKGELVDKTPQNTAKLKGWIDLTHKLAPNLRHSTKEVQISDDRPLRELSDAEVLEQIAERNGVSSGTRGTKAH